MDTSIFLESLYALGSIEKSKRNYTKAMDAYTSFIDYYESKKLELPEEVILKVKEELEECNNMIKDATKGSNRDKNKNTPYESKHDMGKKKTLRGKPYQRLKNIPREEQKVELEKLWQEMERKKMDIEEGSKWYIVSNRWFNDWKQWTGFSTTSKDSDAEITNDAIDGEISSKASKDNDKDSEEPGRIDNYDIIESGEVMLFGEINLLDNLEEEQDYIIVNPDIWRYLYSIYDGTPILRNAIKNFDKAEDSEIVDSIIEVNLVKLYIFEVPREHKQDYYEVMLASRNFNLMDIKIKICNKKKVKEGEIRLWKIEKPSNLDKFYNELEHEWKKYKTLRIDGELMKYYDLLVKDANFSRDDFLMLEYPIPTSNENGYALVEIEKKDIHEALNAKASKALKEDDTLKEALSHPKTLEFMTIPITLVTSDESVTGACGLSNLGNT
jgi:hypothetical protein